MSNEKVEIKLDSLVPPEMAARAEDIGLKKAGLDLPSLFLLAILAGAFIAMGGVFSTTVATGGITVKAPDGTTTATLVLPFGLMRLVFGLSFTVGLIMVMIAGAELFTGNTLIIMGGPEGQHRRSCETGRGLRRQFLRAHHRRAVFHAGQYTSARVRSADALRSRRRRSARIPRPSWGSSATPWSAWRSGCVTRPGPRRPDLAITPHAFVRRGSSTAIDRASIRGLLTAGDDWAAAGSSPPVREPDLVSFSGSAAIRTVVLTQHGTTRLDQSH